MAITSSIELRDLILPTDIGTYGPDDPVPDHHILDLILGVKPGKCFVPADGMAHVFDYDPLVHDIQTMARTGHRETQEWLVTQIAQRCALEPDILFVDIYLRKFPVSHGAGTLGVRLALDQIAFAQLGDDL